MMTYTYLRVELIDMIDCRLDIAFKDELAYGLPRVYCISVNGRSLDATFLCECYGSLLVALMHKEVHHELVHQLGRWHYLI